MAAPPTVCVAKAPIGYKRIGALMAMLAQRVLLQGRSVMAAREGKYRQGVKWRERETERDKVKERDISCRDHVEISHNFSHECCLVLSAVLRHIFWQYPIHSPTYY